MIKLLRCKTCGKIFKIVKEDRYMPSYIKRLHTDLGGTIPVYNEDLLKCIHCGMLSNYELINTESWIADLLFA